MTEREFENELMIFMDGMSDDLLEQIKTVSTFQNSGVMTNNKGLVVTMTNGEQFQITIVKG